MARHTQAERRGLPHAVRHLVTQPLPLHVDLEQVAFLGEPEVREHQPVRQTPVGRDDRVRGFVPHRQRRPVEVPRRLLQRGGVRAVAHRQADVQPRIADRPHCAPAVHVEQPTVLLVPPRCMRSLRSCPRPRQAPTAALPKGPRCMPCLPRSSPAVRCGQGCGLGARGLPGGVDGLQDEWCAERQPAEQQEDDAEPSGDVTFHNPPSKRAMEKATAGGTRNRGLGFRRGLCPEGRLRVAPTLPNHYRSQYHPANISQRDADDERRSMQSPLRRLGRSHHQQSCKPATSRQGTYPFFPASWLTWSHHWRCSSRSIACSRSRHRNGTAPPSSTPPADAHTPAR